jgi:hypothetical protein
MGNAVTSTETAQFEQRFGNQQLRSSASLLRLHFWLLFSASVFIASLESTQAKTANQSLAKIDKSLVFA